MSPKACGLVNHRNVISIKTHEGRMELPTLTPEKFEKATVLIRNMYGFLLVKFMQMHQYVYNSC